MARTTEYVLHYHRDKNTIDTLTYNISDKHITYETRHKSHSMLLCRDHNFTFAVEKAFKFKTNEQQEEFEQALNNDVKKAREMAKSIEFRYEDGKSAPATHPVMFFLTRFLEAQDKIQDHNNSFWVRHGLFKKQKPDALEIHEVDKPKIHFW